MRLLVNAAPLGWPRCGTRTYLTALLDGFRTIGVADRVDLMLPRGYARVRVVSLEPDKTVDVAAPLRFAWGWEQAAVPLSAAARRHVLLTPYVVPPSVRAVPQQSFTLLDVLPWLPDGQRGQSRVARLVHERMAAHARRAPLCLAISQFSREEGVTHLGLDPARVVTVPLAPAGAFHPRTVAARSANLVAAGITEPYVLYVGGYGPRKRPADLVASFAASTELRKQQSLVLVGSPPASLLCSARAAGVRVVVAGSPTDEQLADLYSGASTTCYLTEYEGFGLPPVEADACGSTVVTSPLPPIVESLGDRALYAPDLSPEPLAAAVLRGCAARRSEPRPSRTWRDVAAETWDAHEREWPELGGRL